MDAARQGHWATYGGSPGMTYLLGAFTEAMEDHGIGAADRHRTFVANPARAYGFAPPAA